MNKKISTTIEAGSLVAYHDKLWLAVEIIKTRPCYSQCAMYADGYCRGYCYRWDNGEDFVFHLAGLSVQDATEIVQTPDLIGAKLGEGDGTSEQRAKRKYYEKVKARREAEQPLKDAKKKTKAWGQGSVSKNHGQYRADFYINGTHLHFASSDLAEVEAWLAGMNAKKAALKMKKN